MSTVLHNQEFVQWAAGEEHAAKYHAVLCDPPYGIAFMGKKWDDAGGPESFQLTVKGWGTSLLPLLHPGALVFMFGGTRMWHRLAAGMEDAGFHLWDTLMWLHGQGFPKAQDISKLIDKGRGHDREVIGDNPRAKQQTGQSGTETHGDRNQNLYITAPGSDVSAPWVGHKTPQLKPAWEPILAFKAPSQGKKYADLALEFGSGCLNVDAGRIESVAESFIDTRKVKTNEVFGKYNVADYDGSKGRYPANLMLDEETAPMLDEQSGVSEEKARVINRNGIRQMEGFGLKAESKGTTHADKGGASRFFYIAKASRSEREAGLTNEKVAFGMSEQAKNEVAKGTTHFEKSNLGLNTVKMVRNDHPTVKPIALNKWLASLLLPPSSVTKRRILVPFAGVGSEMIGASQAGWDEVVGVEMDKHYTEIASERFTHHLKDHIDCLLQRV